MIRDNALETELRTLFGKRFIVNADCIQDYSANTGGFIRTIKAIVRVQNTQEVQSLIRSANLYQCPLYPFSTGKNWGLGSKLPVEDGAVLVDLSAMNQIEIDERHAYALIEPGVTQQQLYDYIQQHDLPFLMNVTGSGSETSILGNALDRGDGYFSLRSEDIKGIEVVLGNGKLLKTGYGHFKNASANYLYPDGLGPSLNGMFSQSNYGIVTKAAIALVPKCEVHGAITCGLHDETRFAEFIDDISVLRQQKLWTSIVHIGNQERSGSALLPILTDCYQQHKSSSFEVARKLALQTMQKEMRSVWTCVGSISGTKKQVKAAFVGIHKRLSKYGKVSLLTNQKIMRIISGLKPMSRFAYFERKYLFTQAIQFLFSSAQGKPNNHALKSMYWESGQIPKNFDQPTQTSTGLLFTLPLIPLEGNCATELINMTRTHFVKHGFKSYITLNTLNAYSLGAVINILFDKTKRDEMRNATDCIAKINEMYKEKGFLPYRMSIDGMTGIIDPDDTFWQTVQELKTVLDPNGIISPGRYNLT